MGITRKSIFNPLSECILKLYRNGTRFFLSGRDIKQILLNKTLRRQRQWFLEKANGTIRKGCYNSQQ